MNAPQQVSISSSLIVRLVMTVLPRSWRNHNLRQELWFHVRPPFSFDPTALPSDGCRVGVRRKQGRKAARPRQSLDKTCPHRVRHRRKYHWDCLCLPHNCGSGWCARDFDHVRLRLDQFSCQCLCSVEVRSHPADIKLKIRSKPPSQLRHPPKEGLHPLLPLRIAFW
jgi:hypothetical protein